MGFLKDLNLKKPGAAKPADEKKDEKKPMPGPLAPERLPAAGKTDAPSAAAPPSTELNLPGVVVAGKEDTHAYEREREESRLFDAEAHAPILDTVPRIGFGSLQTPAAPSQGTVETEETDPCGEDGHLKGYVISHGNAPSATRGKLSLVGSKPKEDGDDVYAQLMSGLYEDRVDGNGDKVQVPGVAELLETHSLKDDGPYADKDGQVAKFADVVFAGVKRDDLSALIERIIDIRPFTSAEYEVVFPRKFKSGYNFVYRTDFMPPDELPRAGEILSQDGRLMRNKVSKAMEIHLVHPMEPYILAAAALRARDYAAYPAFALISDADGNIRDTMGLIAVLDMKQKHPLTTFDLKRGHPAFSAIDILSDVAVMGSLHAMRAESRVKHLAAEMVSQSKEGKLLPNEDAGLQLKRIARSLFESAKRWDDNPFIPRATSLLHGMIGDAALESMINTQRVVNGEEVAGKINAVVENMIDRGIDPAQVSTDDPIISEARGGLLFMLHTRQTFVEVMQTFLGVYLSKAGMRDKG